MVYLATSINESPVIVDKAGVAIDDVRGKAVKFAEDGTIALCGAGEIALGVGIMTNDKSTAAGEDVHIQIKDIGLVKTGAAITKGAALTTDVNGCFIPAATGYVSAIALEAAADAGVYIKARLTAYKMTGGTLVTTQDEIVSAIAEAEDGAVITLANDLTLTDTLAIDKSMTLNLNGKTIKSSADIWTKAGTLTVENGTIESAADGFVVGDYVGGSDKATGDVSLIIGKGVTIRATGDNCNAVYIRSTDHNASLITSGELISTGTATIQGNGSAKGNVTITGGSVTCENGHAIYFPQDGDLTITGGTISGKVGLEIRAGSLTISGGEINGSIDAFPGLTPNGNGTTSTTGAAVVVSQHSTNKAIDVSISGGTLTGYQAFHEEDVQDESTGDGITISITGGTFNGNVSSENAVNFISGGRFTQPVSPDYCATGKTTTTDTDGYYTVV